MDLERANENEQGVFIDTHTDTKNSFCQWMGNILISRKDFIHIYFIQKNGGLTF